MAMETLLSCVVDLPSGVTDGTPEQCPYTWMSVFHAGVPVAMSSLADESSTLDVYKNTPSWHRVGQSGVTKWTVVLSPPLANKANHHYTVVSFYVRSGMSYCKQPPAKFCLYFNTFTRVVEYRPHRPHHKMLPLPISRTTLSIQRSDNSKHKRLTLKIETSVTTITT